MADVIIEYSLDQAIKDGVLVEIFKNRWEQLSGGKPIVATSHVMDEISLAGLLEIWNEFVVWSQMSGVSRDNETFVTTMNGNDVWLIEDGTAFTILYPEDY